MARYRIDFSRLARSEEEIVKDKAVKEFLRSLLKTSPNALNAHRNFENSLPEGHILDSIKIEDLPDLNGKQILEKYVLKTYPEANMVSWDSY